MSAAALPKPASDADFYPKSPASEAKVELGRLLFFDKILSGNKNISCATCHHPRHGSSDGLALPLGEGPTKLGPERRPGRTLEESIHGRVPRNSPALFNLGAREFTRMFHDGRVEVDENGYYESGFISPAKWRLPEGLDNVLAAQAMFPVTSDGEMAGQKGENSIADAASLNRAAGAGGVWDQLASRLRGVPEYVSLLQDAYPNKIERPSQITFVDAANALAAFEAEAFRAEQSPFDEFLAGDQEALSAPQRRGLDLFYGKARCADCHSGTFQTDHAFHGVAMPQIGPGKSDGDDGSYWRASGHRGSPEDFGRGRVTGRAEDRYKFRTPSLRNVAHTGPWGHSGAFDRLEDVVRHHLNPEESLESYTPRPGLLVEVEQVAELNARGSRLSQAFLATSRLDGFHLRDTWVQTAPRLRQRIAAANELPVIELSNTEVDELLAFLHALTDTSSINRLDLVPQRVPSGLPVDD